MVENYNVNVQTLFLRMMLTNSELYIRVMNIMDSKNFDKSLRPVTDFFKEHMEKYNLLPDNEQVKAVTGVDIEPLVDFEQGHYDWFLDEFEKFTRRQELERAILKSADLLEKGDYDPVEKLIKDAVQISLTKDMGTDYFADPKARLMLLKNSNGQISTGWPCMDHKLYGGFNRGELNIFAGGSGSGKSLFMQNLAVNWSQAGLNGAYITLELSEELSAMRIDSMMTDTNSREIFKDIENVEMKVKMLAKRSGGLQIKYLPAQSTVNDLRSYVKELEIKTKKKLDFLCVDYLDLLMPVSAKVSPSDLFIKDKYVSEELRNFAKEVRVLFVTASQLNRSAVEEIQFDHSHISGGISKINTADNVFGIFTSRHMREKGQYQLQLMKTRSSSGVGQNIELAFDLNTLRITDPNPDDPETQRFKPNNPQPSPNDIMSRLKPSSTVTSVNEKIHETVDVPEQKVEGSGVNARINALLKITRR
jgi:archaellum biogenesis ATPase FlaH